MKQLEYIPQAMQPWNIRLDLAQPTEGGKFALVEIGQADIETHHQVEVIDEDGRPVRGVWVIFGYPGGGPAINLQPRISRWKDAPRTLAGNAQRTGGGGYAQHTFNDGGEGIFIWHLDENNDLPYSSDIARNCTWQRTPVGRFEHTGVRLVFQLQRPGVVAMDDRLADLEARLADLERRVL